LGGGAASIFAAHGCYQIQEAGERRAVLRACDGVASWQSLLHSATQAHAAVGSRPAAWARCARTLGRSAPPACCAVLYKCRGAEADNTQLQQVVPNFESSIVHSSIVCKQGANCSRRTEFLKKLKFSFVHNMCMSDPFDQLLCSCKSFQFP